MCVYVLRVFVCELYVCYSLPLHGHCAEPGGCTNLTFLSVCVCVCVACVCVWVLCVLWPTPPWTLCWTRWVQTYNIFVYVHVCVCACVRVCVCVMCVCNGIKCHNHTDVALPPAPYQYSTTTRFSFGNYFLDGIATIVFFVTQLYVCVCAAGRLTLLLMSCFGHTHTHTHTHTRTHTHLHQVWSYSYTVLFRLHREMHRALSLLPRRTQQLRETGETGES